MEKLVPKTSYANPDEWQGQRVAFPLRADGKLVGSGTIKVTGSVVVEGVRPPPGTSAIKAWLTACESRQPLCQQAGASAGLYEVTRTVFGAGRQTQFPAVPAGTYYVFGATRYNNQPFFWDLRVNLKLGANSVTLDQRNSTPVN